MKILILSSLEDPHALAVFFHLQEMGAQVDFCTYPEFLEQCAVSFRIGGLEKLCIFERASGNFDLYSYQSIWQRRPGVMRPVKGFIEPWIDQMVTTESATALDGILRSIPCTWVNLPTNDRLCAQKLWQLQVAKAVGLSIPETLVTNKPELVKTFFEQCNGEVIYKLIGETSGLAIPRTEVPCGLPTQRLRREDLRFVDQVVHAPHLFQQCIKKGFDLRATIFGTEIYCIRIDSQSGRGKVDFRDDYTVGMEPFQLPEDVTLKCFALMRVLGLNYGAIDLVLSDEGEIVFIEINCAGQFLWVEGYTQLPLSLAMAKLLAGEIEPLVKVGLQHPDLCLPVEDLRN